VLKGVRIGTDWAAHPPQPVWRHRVGPGWGSFAVVGNLLFTQEQRGKAGEEEAVVCYDGNTGDEVWVHTDQVRFIDQTRVSGVGPRATPTYHEGKIYALGGTGRLNCLEAATGNVIWARDVWEHDVPKDADTKPPMWGFCSSPLVWHGLVTVFTGGKDGKAVSAYDAEKGGEPVWQKGEGMHSYCSPHPARLHGEEQILIATEVGLTALHPTRGDVLWHLGCESDGKLPRCVQPAPLGETDVLLGTGMGGGERRVRVAHDGDSWSSEAVWTSEALNAYYNDRVVHKGHVYGFDGNRFVCVALEDHDKARWNVGLYGNGQVLLLPDQDLLLVLSEKGEVALVAADPAGHRELGRFGAIKGKKTWNHPVVARGKLFVRNGEEAACYELPGWDAGAK
jgi:outer membrane protein assembly factor BamB